MNALRSVYMSQNNCQMIWQRVKPHETLGDASSDFCSFFLNGNSNRAAEMGCRHDGGERKKQA